MGHIEIWGNIVPNLLVMAGRAIKEVSEHIPLKGFKLLDRVVFGLAVKTGESRSVSDSVVFGTTKFLSESPPRAESVTITNV